jgi:hypothetical protein
LLPQEQEIDIPEKIDGTYLSNFIRNNTEDEDNQDEEGDYIEENVTSRVRIDYLCKQAVNDTKKNSNFR